MFYNLFKAKRDLSKLVKVQRTVNKNGKTFTQNFWVLPSKVKSTDKILQGQQNLTQQIHQQPTQSSGGSFDINQFNSLQNDKDKALDYLKQNGITWNEHSHKGINWMRALMALKAYSNSQAITSQPAQSKSQPKSKKSTLTKILSDSDIDEIDKLADGKAKVEKLKKLIGNDECITLAKQLGVQWKENSHAGINFMRMSMALKSYLETNQLKGKVGAPLGNQNAKKDVTQADKKDTKLPKAKSDKDKKDDIKDDDMLQIPARATQRMKNIINLLNTIKDSKVLRLVQKTGMVPEDKESEEFIEKTLLAEYTKKFNVPDDSPQQSAFKSELNFKQRFIQKLQKVTKGFGKKDLESGVFSVANMTPMLNECYPSELLDFRNRIRFEGIEGTIYAGNTIYAGGFFKRFKTFSTYTQNMSYNGEDFICSNEGYIGKSKSEAKKYYDLEKEGFTNILNHIVKNNPEYKDEADKLKKSYDRIMSACDYNIDILNTITLRSYSDIREEADKYIPLVKVQEAIASQVEKELPGYDMSTGTLTVNPGTQPYITFKNGKKVMLDKRKLDSIVTKEYALSDAGTKFTSFGVWMNSSFPSYLHTSVGLSSITSYRSQPLLSINKDMYGRVYKELQDFFGISFVSRSNYSKKLNVKDLPFMTTSLKEVTAKADDTSGGSLKSFLLANLYNVSNTADLQQGFAETAHKKSSFRNYSDYKNTYDVLNLKYASKYIKSSSNKATFSTSVNGVFKTVTPNSISATDTLADFKSADDYNAKILKDLELIPTYSEDYFKDTLKYVEEFGNPAYKGSRFGSAMLDIDNKINSLGLYSTPDMFSDNPVSKLIQDNILHATNYCTGNITTKNNTLDKVKENARKLFNLSDRTSKQMLDDKQLRLLNDGSNLKKLRQDALDKANCTLARVDDTTTQDVQKGIKKNFDRTDDQGNRVSKQDRIYDDRSLLLRDKVYEIKNSTFDDSFKKEATKLNEKPQVTYHGTSYAAACGIIGIDGKFRYKPSDFKDGQRSVGAMMGYGIYAAKLVGKTLPYIGNDSYSYSRYNLSTDRTPDNASDGVLIVMDTVFGKHGEFSDHIQARTNNKNNGGTYDSVAMGAGALMAGGSKLKEYECLVTRNSMLNPKYLVEVGARKRY